MDAKCFLKLFTGLWGSICISITIRTRVLRYTVGSVADPGCLFRIPDPDFYPSRGSRIQQPQQKRRGKKFVATNMKKI